MYRPHIRAQWGGTLGGAASGEIWTNSLRFVTDGDDTQELQDLAETWNPTFEAALRTLVTGQSGYCSQANVEWFKLNAVGADGKQLPTATNGWFAPTDFTAFSGSQPGGPFQNALVVSFETTGVRGLASRGRVFVPAGFSSAQFDANTGLLAPTYVAGIATKWAEFLTSLNDNPGIDFANLRAAVLSDRGDSASNWHEINGVKVGRVYDTQRRRRNALLEGYSPLVTVEW